jgi:hypothetical protein
MNLQNFIVWIRKHGTIVFKLTVFVNIAVVLKQGWLVFEP